ncbi:hypothetical protein EO98_14095 [Methanosarcina sp. 2.H.T.1A.6]|uniref:hypothetical protein n=1 Tax=unclassified Methanosarcina TaxID=2644672 RepID=UPI0006229B61|nr:MULTISPECIES: hypothetical protein [unclassified Methanosarcina]KKG18067.1 hypothetical protein EO94_05930 [Methanosarcina sp. 2.H.T.1A.3]KKG20016.1 hypothetical protein EO98_14095 [Methanosarcina sp. 2.H.T.1A.6]KKG22680.1 hypothetical protein EO96_12550 [Methanosarcina sp. 2.H.T.1A.8]KKG25738.1 hypothetical protein EO97_11230 [Methanosarcina sp. 2.H.T.1A.15]
MRTGQRDVHNTPLKRRLSITYEELETLKKSIKISVLNELQAEMENSSDLDSFKDQILSEIRTELKRLPDSASLKASIISELRAEFSSGKDNDSSTADRRLKELAGIQEGLVRELLDQKMLIKQLEKDLEKLSGALGCMQNTVSFSPPLPPSSPSVSLPILEDPLDLPPLSRKPTRKLEFRKENPSSHELIDFREAPASLPGTNAKVQLKIREVEPEELDEQEVVETKCEYIIAESGDRKRLRGNMRQSTPVKEAPAGQLFPPSSRSSMRRQSPVNADPVRARPDDDYKCEYIIAEKAPKKRLIDESVDLRDTDDAEIITCNRKDPQA